MLERNDPRLKGINLIVGDSYHANLFTSNVYSIGNKSITIVDTGDRGDSKNIVNAFKELNLNMRNIVNVIITHSHEDHWGSLAELLLIVPLKIMVHKEDIDYYKDRIGYPEGANEYEIVGLMDGDVVHSEGRKLTVLHTPGHDSGSICLYDSVHKTLFSGDTVFASGTTGSARSGNIDDLKQSLWRLAAMDIDIMLPGHGNISYEKSNEIIRLAFDRLSWNDRAPKKLTS
jgi:glyoxylase-like metal-dependent hydrolase (beta-lactamase superfamily II)